MAGSQATKARAASRGAQRSVLCGDTADGNAGYATGARLGEDEHMRQFCEGESGAPPAATWQSGKLKVHVARQPEQLRGCALRSSTRTGHGRATGLVRSRDSL